MRGWFPVFYREMLLFRRRLAKLGFVFSSLFVPFLYLLAFGLGLGRSVRLPGAGGSYLHFLLPGLVAMSSMTNAFNSVAINLNMGRNYFRTFQVLVQVPVRPLDVAAGEMLAGVVRGLFASGLILGAGWILGGPSPVHVPFAAALLLNCVLFAGLGLVVGMATRHLEDTSTFSNFIIMPMAFFGGTFFPVDRMPGWLAPLVRLLPLTHTNILIRKPAMDAEGWCALAVLAAYAAVFTAWGARLVRNYSE
ncbi:ABC transporter permease [Dissulfurirhabdus thermomarina]|uniref:Transport permease protein n=1 Tax=Dissulfurirhabdus thermomarina TaxID=1765737 RepID=A0A6N9TMJ4_DISTH|nr:ABC transporter permease [Dissulfurirhabdus thermomarina]NDY41660.1 ABC transporter permease [Dissulfurirhabdus thermomarina]NMX24352.1 ABC transporter permease [Dissulfurirhabdus thermomarina]